MYLFFYWFARVAWMLRKLFFCHQRYKFILHFVVCLLTLFWPLSVLSPEKPLWDLYPPPGCENQSGLRWPGADRGQAGHLGRGWPFSPQDTLEPYPQPGPWNCDWQQSHEGYHWAWYLVAMDGQAPEAGKCPQRGQWAQFWPRATWTGSRQMTGSQRSAESPVG